MMFDRLNLWIDNHGDFIDFIYYIYKDIDADYNAFFFENFSRNIFLIQKLFRNLQLQSGKNSGSTFMR